MNRASGDNYIAVGVAGVEGECRQKQIDVGDLADGAAVCAAITACAASTDALQVELYGSVERPLCLATIAECCREHFRYLEITDRTSLLASDYVRTLARENTVRGLMVKKLLRLCADCRHDEDRVIYELALRELLLRFAEVNGDTP